MPVFTPHLHLAKPGGGSSGTIPDETADIDVLNGNFDVLDSWATATDAGIANAKLSRQGLNATVSVSSGSFTQLDDGSYQFTNAAGISFDNVFDGSGADMYEIDIHTASVGTGIKGIKFRAGGADSTDTFSYTLFSVLYDGTTTNAPGPGSSVTAAMYGYLMISSTATTAGRGVQRLDVFQPGKSGVTTGLLSDVHYWHTVSGVNRIYMTHEGATSNATNPYTGFSLAGYTGFTGNVKIVRK